MLTLLEQHPAAMQAAGVTEIDLCVTLGYQGPCDWEFKGEDLRRIVALDITSLGITCYEAD